MRAPRIRVRQWYWQLTGNSGIAHLKHFRAIEGDRACHPRARDAASPIPWSVVWFPAVPGVDSRCRAAGAHRDRPCASRNFKLAPVGIRTIHAKSNARSAPPRRHVRAARVPRGLRYVRYTRVTNTRVGRILTRAPYTLVGTSATPRTAPQPPHRYTDYHRIYGECAGLPGNGETVIPWDDRTNTEETALPHCAPATQNPTSCECPGIAMSMVTSVLVGFL